MRSNKIFKTFLFFLLIAGFCFGQESVADENWIGEIGGFYCCSPFITYRYDDFTIEDVERAKQKLKSIKKFTSGSEWEGIYYRSVSVGDDRMVWDSEGGFFAFYYYHELRSLNYGQIKELPGLIELVSEKPLTASFAKRTSAKTDDRLVKVKVGERHFLVEENRVRDFAERAVGLSTELEDYSYYWSKAEDDEKKVFGLPVLPAGYKRFSRNPLEARIISVGRKKIIPNEQSAKEFNFGEIHYPVTLNAGKNKNVKSGMNFFVEDLGEWIEITKVFQKHSTGKISRIFGEGNKEQCLDSERGQGLIIACKEIKVGTRAKTKASELYF